jgi:hypothetical protein
LLFCRWCVTGTPIGRQELHDVQALLALLQQQPLADPYSWRLLIEQPLQRNACKWQTA